MAQTLLLGLGGTGSRIVNYVAADLKKKRISINNGQICCCVLDTNENDRDKIQKNRTGVTIVPTSKDRLIEDYLKIYSHKDVDSWMPQSPALLKESMKDGAAQMRVKSRLAFMDTIEDNTIRQLEVQIDKMFDKRDGSKIRVMVVSSLAGGTGSGMFIQTALWLRKHFAKRKCSVTIRGIFVLPDVFINTLKDIQDDETEIQSLYANAYGAIRDLNAITKIKKNGYAPLMPVRIDNLFDSTKGQPDGQPVYDYAFFVDDISEGGSVLTQMEHYEQVIARLVYMQLYAPMSSELYSDEDNLFKRFQKSKEPVFGSCGTAKAIYPAEDVLRYCALRAAQDSLSGGWRLIDEEIKAKQKKEDEREMSGTVLSHRIDPRFEYVRLFENKSKRSEEQVGNNRLFLRIANDVKNEERVPGEDGGVDISYTDKIDDFMDKLEELISSTIDTENPGNLKGIKIANAKQWIEQTTDTKEVLTTLVNKKKNAVDQFVKEISNNADTIAEDILEIMFPADMGDINSENAVSVLGLLTKKDNNNETYFVHPLAVRYLLYRLAYKLEEIKENTLIDTACKSAIAGYGQGKKKIIFDNPKTKKIEDDAIAYLTSRTLLQNEEKFLKNFKELYSQHNSGQYELCRAYAISAVKFNLAKLISKRLEELINSVERFFKGLVKVSNTLRESISENVRKNEQIVQKILYICASGDEKEALYRSLRFSTENSDTNVNKIIVNALYGSFCAKENPGAENNKEYIGKSVESVFFKEVVSAYSELILANNREDIDLDIYSAICKSSDIEFEREKAESAEEESDSGLLDIDFETGEELSGDSVHERHLEAFLNISKRLFELGAPFLISDEEQPEDKNEHLDDSEDDEEIAENIFTPIKKRKTFWGFHPIVAEKCPELASILGINVEKQQNVAYSKNELDCYRAVYGIQAGYVEKFNELKKGKYYHNYYQVVRKMVSEVGASRTDALIHTPHLDKTWHLFLPYITPEKQQLEDNRFYRLFWLSLAYGMISLSSNGKYQIARTKNIATGSYTKNEPILYNGKPVGKVDVPALLAALKLDGNFMFEASALESKFIEECDTLDNYEGTEFLRGRNIKGGDNVESSKYTVGGLASDRDNNAVTIIVRYYNAPKHNDDIAAMLIQSLENLCFELVSSKYDSDEQSKVQAKAYELCKRIYTASTMRDKDIDLIGHWKGAWSK